jgi:catechol 2,3-dioxygenase-like lactoylglutathione lyase family enzyme
MTDIDLVAIEDERARIRATHLRAPEQRPQSSARGLHHAAVLCADVERTIRFYQDLLEFPLTDIFENRDYQGSNHFFFDIGNGNLLAFFSVVPAKWERLKGKLDEAGVPYQMESGTSIYFRDPDGARMELIADPLGEMYGSKVL